MDDPFWIVIERLQAELEELRIYARKPDRGEDGGPVGPVIDVLITFPDGKRYAMNAKVHPAMSVASMLHRLAGKTWVDLPLAFPESPPEPGAEEG